jgi:acetone carboxylase gamma subunit
MSTTIEDLYVELDFFLFCLLDTPYPIEKKQFTKYIRTIRDKLNQEDEIKNKNSNLYVVISNDQKLMKLEGLEL